MRYYITTVKAKGSYNRQWTSHLSYARVKLDLVKNKLIIIKRYAQKEKKKISPKWVYPWFPQKELDLLKERAYWNYNTFILDQPITNHSDSDTTDSTDSKDKKINRYKHHKEELCERCLEIGHYCKYIPST